MIIYIVCLVIILVGVGYYMYPSYNKISFKESLDLTELPVITFNCKGKKLNFLLDTGASLCTINESVVDTIEHKKTEIVGNVFGMEGNKIDTTFIEITFDYKNTNYSHLFQVVDMQAAFDQVKQTSGVTLHGILGSDFFQKYKYVIDFNELVAYSKFKFKK